MESINPTAPNGECIRVLYEDRDRADYTQETLDQLMTKASIPIGEVGFVFIKKFGSAGYFNSKVIKVLTNGKQLCEFCDNARHSYTLYQLEVYSKIKKF